MQQKEHDIDKLAGIIKTLRGKNGCPWDKKQTTNSLIKHLREETEELIAGINNQDTNNVCEELGDLTYLILMITEIHTERGDFTFSDVVKGISDKLVRRHPHVFADAVVKDEQDLQKQWAAIKQAEKAKK